MDVNERCVNSRLNEDVLIDTAITLLSAYIYIHYRKQFSFNSHIATQIVLLPCNVYIICIQ